MIRSISLALALAVALLACDGSAQTAARCANCGMRVDPTSAWRAGATRADGAEVAFDSPKCLLRWIHGDAGRGARDPWVTEYYASARRAATSLFFVVGSDVRGPMGRDAIPIEGRERADRFSADHHGERVLAWSEIDAAAIDALFRP